MSLLTTVSAVGLEQLLPHTLPAEQRARGLAQLEGLAAPASEDTLVVRLRARLALDNLSG